MKRYSFFPMLVMGLCVVLFSCTNFNSKKAKTTTDSVSTEQEQPITATSTEQEQPITATSNGKLKGFEWLEGNWFGYSYSRTATIKITPKYYQLAWGGPITADTPKMNYTISKKYDDPDDDEYWIDPDKSLGFSKGDEETIEIKVGVSDIIYLSKGDYREVEIEDRTEREEFNQREDPQNSVFEQGFDENGYLCFAQKVVEYTTPDGRNICRNLLYLHPYSNSGNKYRGKAYVVEYHGNPVNTNVFVSVTGDYEVEGDHLRVFNLHTDKKNFNDHNYQITIDNGDLRLIGPEIAYLNDVGGYRGSMKQCFADRDYCAIIERRNEF